MMGEALLFPAFLEHLDPFLAAPGALLDRKTEGAEVALLVAHAHAQDHAAAGDLVDDRGVLGRVHRMPQRDQRYAGSHFDFLGGDTDHSRHQDDVGDVAVFLLMMFAEQAAIESALFRDLRLDDRLAQDSSDIGAARRILGARKISDLHSFSSLMLAIAYLATCSLSTARPGCAVRRSQHRSCRVVPARPRPHAHPKAARGSQAAWGRPRT